jgi:hypothetical protein
VSDLTAARRERDEALTALAAERALADGLCRVLRRLAAVVRTGPVSAEMAAWREAERLMTERGWTR